MRAAIGIVVSGVVLAVAGCGPRPTPEQRAKAVEAFATVQAVFQHPRCRNCHISGDAPLQYDAGTPHAMGVLRGEKGHGMPGLQCNTCHGNANLPASYGPHAPPGAPHWALPGPEHKMAWFGLSAAETCAMVKDRSKNGGRSFGKLIEHVSSDSLVLWGWHPGGAREPVPVPHDEFVAKFKQWAAAGGPCPEQVEALVHQYDNAWNQRDTLGVSRLLAPAYQYFSSRGEVSSRAETMAFLSSPEYRLEHAERSEITLALTEPMAVVSSRWRGRGTYRGEAFLDDQRCGQSWVRSRETWRLVSEHCVQIAAAAP